MRNRLQQIKSRLMQATPEPWVTPKEAKDRYGSHGEVFRSWEYDRWLSPQLVVDHEGCDVWPWKDEADMVFAYNARADVPWLVEKLELFLRFWEAWDLYERRGDELLVESEIEAREELVLDAAEAIRNAE